MKKILLYLGYFFSGLILLSGIISGSAGAYTLVSQVGLFFRSGYWVEVPLMYLLIGLSPAVLPEKVLQHLETPFNPFVILEINKLLTGSNSLQEWLSESQSWPEVHEIVVRLFKSIPISIFLLGFSVLVSLGGLTIMSSISEAMDKRPSKKGESTDRGTLPCVICGKRVRQRKYKTHWARCFIRNEKSLNKGT